MTDYKTWFETATASKDRKGIAPHPWQLELASNPQCANRLIRIPTGMGKTLGVLSAWVYHRVHCIDTNWPTRLIWCLPMRTLVEQTANEARSFLDRVGFSSSVGVHCLMGGVDESDWFAQPEKPEILVGTQDMLLSRALNRGYAMGRAAWPRAFGMINSDTLWVMDEVQLMGVGLTSSAQIQTFWESYRSHLSEMSTFPRATWWMSATLQPDWLASPEVDPFLPELKSKILTVATQDRRGTLWDVRKTNSIASIPVEGWAELIANSHTSHLPDRDNGRQTLVVVNTVKRAKELFTAIEKQFKGAESRPDLRLIHSRFRPYERRSWASEFLSRATLSPAVNRILIATQVVEAGVDISASCLLSELAPWPSLVQRFGRAARYGGSAQIFVLDSKPEDDKKALPYSLKELNAARDALQVIPGVSIRDLEEFESRLADEDPIALQNLYPFQPLHVLMQQEFEELFDNSPDLSGADMDVSRFIREGEDERDVQIFWRDWDSARPEPELQPLRDELCSVSITDAKAWVKKVTTVKGLVWFWNYVDGRWQAARADILRPGIVLLVAANVGGYEPAFGFTGEKPKKGQEALDIRDRLKPMVQQVLAQAEIQEGSDSTSIGNADAEWKTIFTHCKEAAEICGALVTSLRLTPRYARIIDLAIRLHDWGKAHPSFSKGTYRVLPIRTDLAKAPKKSWRALSKFYDTNTHGPRPGFRHELASCLATLELLRQSKPNHPALLDGYGGVLQFRGDLNSAVVNAPSELLSNRITHELAILSVEDFNLLLYLIASHHGKVRLSLQASPHDQDFPDEPSGYVGFGMPIRGIRQGDVIPSTAIPDGSGANVQMPPITLSLSPATIGLSPEFGPSWSERTQNLVSTFGPFLMGYLEAVVRTIDGRASALPTQDPLLAGVSLTVPDIRAVETGVENEPADLSDDEEMSNEAELEDSNV